MRALALAMLLCWGGTAEAACRQALALGLDISGSVSAGEYRLQLDGLAGALGSRPVRRALLAVSGATVDLAVFEWSGPDNQRLLVDWTTLRDHAAIDAVADRLRATTRRPGTETTAIGAAMLFGAGLLDARGGCWRRVLDISGDGKSNTGPRPRETREAGGLAGITVNALVIAGAPGSATRTWQRNVAELTAYFHAEVIRGPDAFIETAMGYEDFRRAMERKLIREIRAMVLGAR